MAAGLGFKDFVTGEVLTAADVDGYLMQGVWVFASAAARDAAVTSPQEGNFAYLKDTNVTTYYTGSAWANLDTTGMTNPMTTTGDTIYSSSGSTPARLGIGSTGQVLTVAGGVPSWATAAGGSANWTLLNSGGTTLSGNASVTVSGISGKDKILVIVSGASPDSGSNNAFCNLRLNSDSGSNYYYYGFRTVANSTYSSDSFVGFGSTDTALNMARWSGNSASVCNGYALFTGCNSSGVKSIQVSSGADGGGGNEQRCFTYGGYYNSSSTISSVTLLGAGAYTNFDAGTIFVYTSA